jgi:hypothetical protein
MPQLTISEDLEECRRAWECLGPPERFFDLWPVRNAFQESFGRPPRFIIAGNGGGKPQGLLPLSWIEEEGRLGCFPGETWHGATWLEQNRIIASDAETLQGMIEFAPEPIHMRYCVPDRIPEGFSAAEDDETGYFFYPGNYEFSFTRYMDEFSRKSRKQLARDRERLEANGVEWRHDRLSDVEQLFRMNIESFGGDSYFSEPRFFAGFENLVSWLSSNGLLRITTVLLGGRFAAVDIGAVWSGEYVLLAGGTCAEFQGVAKMINLHHMEWACGQRLKSVDFLCGNFGWKERFHLSPRPLYQICAPGENCGSRQSAREAQFNA